MNFILFSLFNNLISLLYGLRGLRVIWRLLKTWNTFWDVEVTSDERTLAGELAFFVLIPLGVFLHEAGHALATWQVGGQVVDFQWRVFWGYVVPIGDFTPAQAWWIAFSGNLVSILIGLLPIPLLPRLGSAIWGELLYAYVRHQLFYALVWYPAVSFLGFGGDWLTIYDFSMAPYAQVTLILHVALLYGLRRLDKSAWAARWRMGRDSQALAALQKLESEAAMRPGDVKPLLALAHFYQRLGERGLARRYEDQAQRLAPADPSLKVTQALMAFDRKQYPRAQAAAKEALAASLPREDQARMYQVLGFSLMEEGHREAALAHLDTAVNLMPDYANLYYWRAILKRSLGRRAEARLDFELAARLAPDEDRRAEAQRELAGMR